MKGPMVPPLPRPSRDSAILSDAVHRQCEIGIHRRSPRQGAGGAGPADARPSSPRSRPAEWVRPVAGSGFDPPEKWVRSRARPRKWVRSAGKMGSIPRPPPEMGPFRRKNGSDPAPALGNGSVPPEKWVRSRARPRKWVRSGAGMGPFPGMASFRRQGRSDLRMLNPDGVTRGDLPRRSPRSDQTRSGPRPSLDTFAGTGVGLAQFLAGSEISH
jgi:hypothetical protein